MLIQQVVQLLEKSIPGEVPADWDNIGILIDSNIPSEKIILTIDITPEVIKECIENNIKIIVSYHPVIFQGIKKLKANDLVTRLVQEGISVYSPHTKWDNWMNNYLYKKFNSGIFIGNMGSNNLTIKSIIEKSKILSGYSHLRVAYGIQHNKDTILETMLVGVGSAFKYHKFSDSVIITGEMDHHCILHSIQNRNTVILLEHSTSERITLIGIKNACLEYFEGHDILISKSDTGPIKLQ